MLHNFTSRKNLNVLLAIIFSLTITNLNAQVIQCVQADFTFIETDNGQVTLVGSTDIPVNEWLWQFGDGNTSNEKFPTHIYEFNGEYDVCLKVHVDENCIGNICKKINVQTATSNAACDLTTDFQFVIQDNLVIAYGTSSGNLLTRYFWDFGDGERGEGLEIKHLYPIDGDYEICLIAEQPPLTINEEPCRDTLCRTVTISTNSDSCQIDADFDFELSGNQLNAVATSNAGDSATYIWKISDGTSYGGLELNHEFTQRGDYEICLLVIGTSSSGSQTCSVTICKKVSVEDILSADCEVEADFIFIESNLGLSVQANSNDPNAEYHWTIEGMNVSLSGREVYLPINFTGVYVVCLTVTSPKFNCRKQICKRKIIGRSGGFITPNPVSDIIQVSNLEVNISSFSLINTTSGLATSQIVNGHLASINVSHLTPGMYLLSIIYEDGSQQTEKIFKQ